MRFQSVVSIENTGETRKFMRIVSLILLGFLFCANFYAQDKKESEKDLNSLLKGNAVVFDDGCGDPTTESQRYKNREGKITKIINANQVTFEQKIENGNKKKKTFIVELVGIDSVTNQEKIKQFLEKYILNQNVEITGNLKKETDKKFNGLIFVDSEEEDINWINENLLENGIAKYKSFESANLVSMVTPCRLQKAEETAKSANLGIWAK